ncbi:MAG TPA: TonB-dependent receptor [Gemmatimonadales bacterium]|nr:TonB-dependent receptor [Gemmatimonadales bacterium]
MKQSCVSAFARAARPIALAAVALVVGAGSLLAQATGKLEGRVRDQAGAPIANAQVFIVGTAFNALTNPQGYYFINNVPAGTISVRAAFIGYRSTQVDGVKILAGQTITTDIQLEQTAVEIQEITVVQQTQPLVPRDEVTTKQRVDGTFTEQLPVDRLENVLTLQPGVSGNPSGVGLSIRGGRQDEAATYIDGVPVVAGNRGTGFIVAGFGLGSSATGSPGYGSAANSTSGTSPSGFANTGGTNIQVGTNAFEEASVTTGASSAEFGNAQSGIVQIATKAGSSTGYTGTLAYETDEPFGKGTSVGLNRIQGSLGGPLYRGVTFWLSGVLEGRKSMETGLNATDYPIFNIAGVDTTVVQNDQEVPIYNFAIDRGDCDFFSENANQEIADNFGQDCNGIRVPNSNTSAYQLSGKLNYTYGTGSRVAFTMMASQGQGRLFNYGDLYNFAAAGPGVNRTAQRAWNRVFTLNWTHNLAKTAERALALDMALSYQQDRFLSGPLEYDPEVGTLGFFIKPIPLQWDFETFPLTDQLIENYRNNTGTRTPYNLDIRDSYEETDAIRNNAYGLSGYFSESGGNVGYLSMSRENRWIGKANLDWQADRYNRIKLGGEFTRYDIAAYGHVLNDPFFSDAFHEKPVQFSAYAEDRLDLGDVVLVGGLRYDRYDSRAGRPYFTCTAARDLDDGADDGFCGSVAEGSRIPTPYVSANPNFTRGDVASIDELYFEDEAHDYLSPHVQVSFPVTDRTNFRLSYAHQVQTPDFALILGGINTDLGITNTNQVFGTDLDFGRTITFEFGIRHAFSDDMVLDLAAYNKDNLANPAGRLVSTYDPTTRTNVDIRQITNADFGNTRGIDVRLDRRFGNLFNGTIAYSFQDARNTGTDPFTYINFGSRIVSQIAGGNQPPPQAIAPTTSSRPHSLSGAVSVNFPGDWREGTLLGSILGNFGAFATFRYTSGTAYTLCDLSGEAGGNEEVLAGQVCERGGFTSSGGLNTARLPAFKQFDLRFTKGFGLGGVDLTAYLDVRNVLNLRNILSVFVDTRDVTNEVEEQQNWSADSINFFVEADANGAVGGDGAIDLTFGGGGRAGCAGWVDESESSSPANCLYLIQAEQRWGDGDGVFTLEEQRTASREFYYVGSVNQGVNQDLGATNGGRGLNNFTAPGRRVRLGLELNF